MNGSPRIMTPVPSAQLPPRLRALHARVRTIPFLARFTLATRLLMLMAFLPTGLVKATGQRFTLLPVENPVGFFFEAMYQTGPYWYFIGIMQVLSAILIVIPATATLGALLFFPIILSIVLVTWGIGFGLTAWITTAMLLAVVFLLCWDADRIWAAGYSVLGRRPVETSEPALFDGMTVVERAGWWLGGSMGLGLFLATRGFVPKAALVPMLVLGGASVLLVVAGWGMTWRQSRRAAARR